LKTFALTKTKIRCHSGFIPLLA